MKENPAAHLKKCEAQVILEEDAANTPHVTRLAPTQFCTETHSQTRHTVTKQNNSNACETFDSKGILRQITLSGK